MTYAYKQGFKRDGTIQASGLRIGSIVSNALYELRCQLTIDDASALWDSAATKAMTYPDMTPETVVEMIGPREDPEIAECLLLLLQPSVAGCELVTLSCDSVGAAISVPAISVPTAEIKPRAPTVAIGAVRPPPFLRTWNTRVAAELSRAVRIAE